VKKDYICFQVCYWINIVCNDYKIKSFKMPPNWKFTTNPIPHDSADSDSDSADSDSDSADLLIF
jgi:hypothetical protein